MDAGEKRTFGQIGKPLPIKQTSSVRMLFAEECSGVGLRLETPLLLWRKRRLRFDLHTEET